MNASEIILFAIHVASTLSSSGLLVEIENVSCAFQVLYAGEGESRKPDDTTPPPDLVTREEKPGTVRLYLRTLYLGVASSSCK